MKKILQLVLLLVCGSIYAQTPVSSLAALRPFLDQDNVNVKLAPGVYSLSALDVSSGVWGNYTGDLNDKSPVMLFTGSNSTYDFTGVTIMFDTDIFLAFGNTQVYELNIIGNNNVLKNLTMVDDGSVNDAPQNSIINIVMDGIGNTIEGFDVSTKGSYPYGYGDAFGKGGGEVPIPYKKHSAILLRGNSNILRNTNLVHKGYGHCVVFQGAQDPLVEGCYIESEVRSTDDMLTETSGPAYDINFMTRYGFRLPAGYTKALCEDGLRAYSDGVTVKDGVVLTQSTTNITIKNNTVKNARNGCHMTFSGGTTHIENITLIGCELGFSPGNNTLINCSADCTYGPAYYNHYENTRSGVQGDLTILDPVGPYHNGNGVAAFFGGDESANINLHGNLNGLESGLVIKVGGNSGNLFDIGESDQEGENKTINNNTNFPIVINALSTNNTITTCGIVEDNGSSNIISESVACSTSELCYNTADNLEAECYDTMLGIDVQDITGEINERGVFNIHNNDWISFNDIDLTGVTSVNITAASVQSSASIEVRSSSTTGPLLATVLITNTSSLTSYQDFSNDLDQTIDGETDLYFIFKGGADVLFNLNRINFIKPACFTTSHNAGETTSATAYCESLGVVIEGSAPQVVGSINSGDYIRFSNYDFGPTVNFNAIEFSVSSNTSGGAIEVRNGGLNGDLLTSVAIENTGSWNTYQLYDAYIIDEVSGVQDLYIVFKGDNGFLFNLESFQVYIDDCVEPVLEGTQINAEDFCDNIGADIKTAGEGGYYIAAARDGDYYGYGVFDFNTNQLNEFQATFGKSSVKDSFIELRLDSPTGTLVATIDGTDYAGGSQNWETRSTTTIQPVTGIHKLYVVIRGQENTSLVNFNWFRLTATSLSIDGIDLETRLINVSPNPTHDNLFVNLSNYMNTSVDYVVSTIGGRQIRSGNWDVNHQDKIKLELGNLQNGIYILQVKPLGCNTKAIKFVVSN